MTKSERSEIQELRDEVRRLREELERRVTREVHFVPYYQPAWPPPNYYYPYPLPYPWAQQTPIVQQPQVTWNDDRFVLTQSNDNVCES